MADKKISELDVIGDLTGSNPIFPLVQGGNTLQINASALAVYASQWSATTASFNTFVSTQNAVNLGIAIATGSFNQFTASLDATYATDEQLLQLYQATASIELATASINTSITSLNSFSSSIQTEVGNIEAYTASLKSAAIVSSSQQILNYNIFVTTSSLNIYTSSQDLVNLGISIVTGSLNSQTSSQDLVNLGISEVTSSLNSYTSSNESWKDGVRGEVNGLEAYTASLKGAIEVNGQDVNVLGMITAQQFNVTYVSSSTLYQSGSTKFGDTSDDRHEFTGSVDISGSLFVNDSVEAVNLTGSLLSTNGVVSSSNQLFELNEQTGSQDSINLGISIVTGSLNEQTGSQDSVNLGISIVTGSLNQQTGSQDLVNLGISTFTGSIREEVNGIEAYTASLKGQAIVSSSTQISNYYKFAETASANTFYGTQTFSGSFNVSGSTVQIGDNTLTGNTILSGSINISGSTTFNGNHTLSGSNTIVGNTLMTGTNTIIGNTEMSGSITVSGSSDFKNSVFIVTGSSHFTGSHFVDGNSVFSGSINIASGSSYYRAGNKLFNYGQWGSLETQSGSANTAYAMKLDMQYNGAEGVYVANDGSGFPTRLTVENTGLYNIQFSTQLHAITNTAIDFSIWFAKDGTDLANSNTDYSIEKVAGGGFAVAALNILEPISSGSYVELYWSTTNSDGQLQYKGVQSTPTRPATPSIIVTVTQIA